MIEAENEKFESVIHATSKVNSNNIHHECTVIGPCREAFLRCPPAGELAAVFGTRFPQIDTYPVDLTGLPESIAVIPLLTNILPIAWCYGATVYVGEVDRDFFEAAHALKRAFESYYPALPLSGELVADRLVDNRIKEPKTSPLLLFSGGVDATFSMWGNLALRPQLVSIRGADVYFTSHDDAAWDSISCRHREIANALGSHFYSIESSFKTWLAHWNLNKFSKQAGGVNWWHSHQHGAALIGLCAPLAWKLQSKRIIISSSMSNKDISYVTCGSNPSIDECIRYFGATVQHYDFTVTRQEKLAFLCEEQRLRNIDIPLRVCWKERTGYNCCKCDKCLRTIFGLCAEGGDPARFGFGAKAHELVQYIEDPKIQMGGFWFDVIAALRKAPQVDGPHIQAVLRKAAATPLFAKAGLDRRL